MLLLISNKTGKTKIHIFPDLETWNTNKWLLSFRLPNNNSLDRSSSLSLYDNENTTASNMRPNVGDSIYQVPVNRQSIGFDEPSVVSIELLETNSKNEEVSPFLITNYIL